VLKSTTTTTTTKGILVASSIISGIINSLTCLRNMEGFYMRIFTKKPEALKMSRGNAGFTLAEVLITLGIIGLVAALTIPTVLANSQKTQYITSLKKAYSVTNQAFKLMMVDEGVYNFGDTSMFDGSDNTNAARNVTIDATIKKYFKTVKTCEYGDSSCQITGYKTLGGVNAGDQFSGDYNFYTADGMAFYLYLDSNCTPDNSKTGKIKSQCGYLSVDLNGPKSPNKLGRDFFTFAIASDGLLYPQYGVDHTEYDGDSSSYWKIDVPNACGTPNSDDLIGADGSSCAARIMEEDWEMNY